MFVHVWERWKWYYQASQSPVSELCTLTDQQPSNQRERGRYRIQSRLQALSCQHRAWCGAWTHQPWDHDLSRSQTLTQLSHPVFILKSRFSPLLLCSRPSCQPTSRHFPPELYLRWGCVSKPFTSESPVAWTCSDSLGDGLIEQWSAAFLPHRKFVVWQCSRGLEIMIKHNTHLVPGITAPWHFCYNTSKHGCSLGSAGTFAYGEAIWPLPNVLLAEKLPLPVWPMDPSDLTACSWSVVIPTRALWSIELQNFWLFPLFIES